MKYKRLLKDKIINSASASPREDFFCSGVTSTPLGGAVYCNQVKPLEKPFLSLRTLSAHPSQLEIGVLSSSMSVAPPSS